MMRPSGSIWRRLQPQELVAILLFAALVIASLVNSFYVPLAGRRARPEHLVGPIVFGAFVLSQLVWRARPIRLDAFALLAAAWVLVNGLSSWLYAPQPAESFVHVARMGILAGIFLTVANLPTDGVEAWARRVRVWLALGAAQIAYGVLIWTLASYAGIWWPGVSRESAIAGVSVQGTQFERNLFGIFAATLLAVAAYLFAAQRTETGARPVSARALAVAGGLAAVAVVISLTRSAWLGVVAAAPLAYLLLDRRSLARTDGALVRVSIALPIVLVAGIGLLRMLPAPSAAAVAAAPPRPQPTTSAPASTAPDAAISERVATLGRLGSDFTANTRLMDARWAVEDWLGSPLLGHGAGSFGQLHGIRVGTEAWISNMFLHAMVDTGIVGLGILTALLVLVSLGAWRASLTTANPRLAIGLRALTLGLFVMVVGYQFTSGTWLAVFWIHLGLIVNGMYLGASPRPQAPGA